MWDLRYVVREVTNVYLSEQEVVRICDLQKILRLKFQ